MRRDYILLAIAIAFVTSLLTFGSALGFKLQGALRGPLPPAGESGSLRTVSATVEGYGESKTLQTAPPPPGMTVGVYSEYPFNFKNELLIASGAKGGVKEGDAALFEGSLLGVVEKVFADSALVRTIFDARFKTQVRVGTAGADALLVGGNNPKLTLIPSAASVNNNDPVYAVAAGLPYGVGLGTIQNLQGSVDSSFRDANLRVVFNPASVHEVTVVPKPQ